MGGHYGSIHVRSDDADAIIPAVTKLAEQGKQRFLVAPAIDGWVSIFPDGNGQDSDIGGRLAPLLPDKEFIQYLVHDDDVFAYWYYQNGSLKDRYNSCPTYFDPNSTESRGGDAKTLEHLLVTPGTVSKLQAVLDAEREPFELNRIDEFAKLLGLPNAGGAYEYIQEKDCGPIKRLREFVHLPDLKDEKARKREQAAEVREEMRQLKKEGVLLADLVGPKSKSARSSHASPVWTMNPVTGEVLLMWIDSVLQPRNPVWRLNAGTPEPQLTGIELDDKGSRWPIVSKSGQWFSTTDIEGTRVYDLRSKTFYASFPFKSHHNRPRFGADEKYLFRSEDTSIIVLSLADKREVGRIEFKERLFDFAVHPDGGSLLACGIDGILSVIELPSLQVIKRAWISAGGRQYQQKEEWEKVAGGKVSAGELAKEKAPMTEAELESYQKSVGRKLYPANPATWAKFSPDGKWLACISGGLCLIEWSEVMACGEMSSLRCRYFVPSEVVTITGRGVSVDYGNTLAAVFDEACGRVLFSGHEGKVKFLDLTTGEWGDLLAPPERIPLFRIELTPDRSALVGEAITMNDDGARKLKPERLQMWSYPALCKRAGIPF